VSRSTAQIESDIAAGRDELATTIDALGEKLDVKAHVSESASEHWPVLAVAGAALIVGIAVAVWRRRS
jgi:hypothetical protein